MLVLDDFHVIRDAACHRQVEFLIEHLPPRAHLVILTRSDPGLRLGRLRASGALAEIRAEDLASRRPRQRRCSPGNLRLDRHLRLDADGPHRGVARRPLPGVAVAGRDTSTRMPS
ncbi:hypothetical protein [Aeromicrobium sp. UC242_57]|uniref:hypothetical protein n=1 Tax=Aeromicrobium sp. UC242_57 TaxID=3374624 RepID=UPI0037B4B1B9